MHQCVTHLSGEGDTRRSCQLLGVSRSGYYAVCARARQSRELCAVGAQRKGVFEGSVRSYGSRSLAKTLQAQGRAVGRYRGRSLMREHGMRPISKRRFAVTTQLAVSEIT